MRLRRCARLQPHKWEGYPKGGERGEEVGYPSELLNSTSLLYLTSNIWLTGFARFAFSGGSECYRLGLDSIYACYSG